jgi:hypothetical protein
LKGLQAAGIATVEEDSVGAQAGLLSFAWLFASI